MRPTPPKHHVVIALTEEQHARVRARCFQEGKPMSVILPLVLNQWAAEVSELESPEPIRRAKPATYRK